VRQIVVDPAAEQELRAAAQWYSEQEEGLGEEFILEVNRTIEGLAEGAPRHPVWRQGRPYQKVLTHRVPYAVFFTHDDARVRILAIAHRRRKPGYWLRRTR
jgi:plasmid stabilization system protein ParE